MKLLGTTVIALAAGLGTARAQSWQLGARAGLAVTSVAPGWVGSDLQPHLGGSVGVLARHRISEHFSLQPELLYTLAGYKYRYLAYPRSGVYLTNIVDLHYLALPVLVQHRWGGLFTEAGPQFSWLMRAQGYSADSRPADGSNITEYHTRLEAGITAGIGWGRPQGLLVGLRYSQDVTQAIRPSTDRPSYNQSLQLYGGYTFGRATAAGH